MYNNYFFPIDNTSVTTKSHNSLAIEIQNYVTTNKSLAIPLPPQWLIALLLIRLTTTMTSTSTNTMTSTSTTTMADKCDTTIGDNSATNLPDYFNNPMFDNAANFSTSIANNFDTA